MKINAKLWAVLGFAALMALVTMNLLSSPASAAGLWYVATTGDDANDCLSPAKPCASINGAIGKASAGDTILVAIGTYTDTGDEVVLLDKDAVLSGGWDETFTSQGGISTIDGQGSRIGVGVQLSVTAIVDHFVVQNAVALGSGGGGILNSGNLTLDYSTVSDNFATTTGGGILNVGNLTANNSTIRNNSAGDSGGIGNGHTGTSSPITMVLNNSTVSNNTAAGRGGGIRNGPSGTLYLNNSTVSGNTSHSTFGGGGIANETGGAVTLQNSIIAGNIGVSADCGGEIGSSGYNLIGDSSGCDFTPTDGDLTDIGPLLGPLQDNGGPTQTHALLLDSPAIDAGNPAGCTDQDGNLLTTDQRGVERPQGAICDMGAYEVEMAPALLFRARLRGKHEVPPVVTGAIGRAQFKPIKGKAVLGFEFKLQLGNIQDATDGHINCGLEGENGAIGVTLFSGASFSGQGTLTGKITAPDPGNGCGWEDLAAVLGAMRSGNAYVNVHTLANPGGEIRGQIEAVPPPYNATPMRSPEASQLASTGALLSFGLLLGLVLVSGSPPGFDSRQKR